MSITRVQGKYVIGGTTSAPITLTSPVSVGSAVVGVLNCISTAPTITVSDDKGNSYIVLDTASSNGEMVSFYLFNITNSPQTITAHFTTVTGSEIAVDEFSGVATTSPLDGHTGVLNQFVGTGTDAVSSGAITTTQNGDLIWGAVGRNGGSGTVVAGTGFTPATTMTSQIIGTTEYLIQSSAGSIAATGTQSANNIRTFAVVIALSPPATPVTYVPPRRPAIALVNRIVIV